MLRRQFMLQSGLAGAVALPSLPVLAQGLVPGTAPARWRLSSEAESGQCSASQPCYAGTVRIHIRPEHAASDLVASSRLWFQADHGPAAYELASFGNSGKSQGVGLTADTERLLALECSYQLGDQADTQQLMISESGLGHLGIGRHWLTLHDADERALARIQITVQAV